MTDHLGRAYAAAAAVLVLFLAWAVISAHPWNAAASRSADPRQQALVIRERHLRHEALAVRRVVDRRWAVYRVRLAHRRREIAVAEARHRARLAAAQRAEAAAAAARAAAAPAPVSGGVAAPAVRVVPLPPLTITRSS